MNPAVSLGLKYLLGLGAVAGTAGGIVYWKKVSDSKAEEEKAEKINVNSSTWKKSFHSYSNEDSLGLPKTCNAEERANSYSECDLSAENLKRIKFKELEDGEEEVTVTPSDNVSVKLKIILQGDMSKKYSFVNGSTSNIVISKGSKNVTLKASGKTEFLREDKSLVTEKIGNYGIPERCEKENKFLNSLLTEELRNQKAKICVLSDGDLSKIKFHGFADGKDSEVTPLWINDGKKSFENNQAIILTIDNGKYSFDNHFPDVSRNIQKVHRTIKITRGNDSVTLDGNMESVFTVEDGGLKKVEVTVLGFPKRCEIGETEQNKTCELLDNDIRRLKFKETGVSPDILYVPDEGKKMNLRIEKTEDVAYTDKKKYILWSVDSDLTLYNTIELSEGKEDTSGSWKKNLGFNKGVERTFKNENNQLVAI